MNYHLHYQRLMNRSPRKRPKGIYLEKHHIIPKCMGGANNKTNYVYLTPEEHYVAHQLLIKMYPGNIKLLQAAKAMTMSNGLSIRKSNKLYGWLRRKHSESMKGNQHSLGYVHSVETKAEFSKVRTGSGNGMYGKTHNAKTRKALSDFRSSTMWISDGINAKAIPKGSPIPNGWYRGRRKERWITNGITTKRIAADKPLENGWWYGRSHGG